MKVRTYRSFIYGNYSEDSLLGIEGDRKLGLFTECPICSHANYLRFRQSIRNREGDTVISSVQWVTCEECHTSYSVDNIRKGHNFPLSNREHKFNKTVILRKAENR